ncbi:M28 family peptidase [Longimicrobium sp.]|uniref:M28 family peptidase n=1 Tax=Longimicrobium sp. TaxID=2029185 RepID=UPI002E335770|nr:M28 family peptidase [Longimicrobium sp.]HEX6041038.1 M28 family peptidase [Longimicrobium sp.]
MSSYRILVRGLPVLAALAAAQACAPATTTNGQTVAPATSGTDGPGNSRALPLTYAARPTVAEITPGDLMSRLYTIADDSMMGRQAGHRGNVMATDYIAAEFRRMGLEPAGENGTYFQAIPLVVRGIDRDVSLSVAGQALRAWEDFSPLPPSDAFPFGAELRASNTPVVFGGTLGGEMITDAQAAGKLVVLLPGNGANGQPNGRWWAGYPRTRFPNAAGVAVAATEISPPVIRTYGQNESADLQEPGEQPATGPAGMSITRAAAERLLGAPLDGMRPGTAGRTVSGGFHFVARPADAPARNVVAILRGSDPTVNRQYVGISAHNDHEGISGQAFDHDSALAFNTVMRPQGANDAVRTPTPEQAARIRALRDSLSADGSRMDSIYNGADDDGSGTVTLLEIAEAFARSPNKPRRSILFISHTAEEAGLLGSQWFSDHPTVPRDSIVTVLNMDMVGHGRAEEVRGGGPWSIQMIGSRRLSTELGDLIDTINGRRQNPMSIDYSWDAAGHPANRYCRSDHFMYARHGIPITYFSLGYHPSYHMVTDEPQYIDYDHMARVGGFLQEIATEVANRPGRLVVNGPRQDPNAPCRQ